MSNIQEQYGCIKVPSYQCAGEPVYIREISSLDFVTSQPMLPDPYESRMVGIVCPESIFTVAFITMQVDVRQSKVEGAEEGLFSRMNVKAGTVEIGRAHV